MTTNGVVAGDRYMDISRKLHEIERQLLQKGGYPHDLDWLESMLQRATEGRFHPDDDVRGYVRVKSWLPPRYVKSLQLDNEPELLREMQKWVRRPLYVPRPEYAAWVTTVRLQKEMGWNEIFGMLERRGLQPTSFEESCAFLAQNRTLQQAGGLLCLDGFETPETPIALVFCGDQRRRFTRTLAAVPAQRLTSVVRVLAREPIITIP